ncbi:MFS transporter [Aureimonas jatrophae]|uniref:MFS transporter, DHA1 family, inner membrane transport protein n=1 Tax=Aureimonas jatrophae TaxID=1166073 RepID=A0A1H0KV48_9HYPH|nr:MFS transporter [Aureimonas jatrophae]MBB3948883.1 DHA1 family inner membrane transport protein [Aureimonas jatrophae]SDO59661.1 MFS transporter, DHA1 family, inner membrane transport protein [Aureimonas jatrophae]
MISVSIDEPVGPDTASTGRGGGWAIAALSLGSFVIGTGEFGIMGLLPEVARDLGATIPQAGLLITGYALGVVFGAPLLAVLTSRMERRRVLLALAAIIVVGNLACTLSPTYGLLMAARLFTALAHGTFFGVGAVLAAEVARPGRQAQAISLMFVGMTLANVVGVPLGTLVGQAFGWRTLFGVVTALALLQALALALTVPRSVPRADVGFRDEVRVLLRRPVLVAMSISVLASTSLFAVYTYITPLLTDVTHVAPADVPALLLVFGVGMTVGNILGGRAADRFLLVALMGLFLGIVAVLLALWLLADAPAATLVLLFVWGALVFGVVAPMQMRIVQVAAGARNLASTLNQSAFNLGNALGAWAGAGLIGAGAGFRDLPLAGALFAALALVAVLWSRRLDRTAHA